MNECINKCFCVVGKVSLFSALYTLYLHEFCAPERRMAFSNCVCVLVQEGASTNNYLKLYTYVSQSIKPIVSNLNTIALNNNDTFMCTERNDLTKGMYKNPTIE